MTMLDPTSIRPAWSPRRDEAAQPDARLVRRGRSIYHQGDPARHVFEVLSGTLQIARVTSGGRRQVIAFAHPGDIVGLAGSAAHADGCRAVTDARIRPIECARPDPCSGPHPTCAMMEQLERMEDHYLTLGRRSAAERVALFLHGLAVRIGRPRGDCIEVALPMGRADIADHLGLTIESVSRSLTRLRKEGIIALRDVHTVLVPDLEALSDAAEVE